MPVGRYSFRLMTSPTPTAASSTHQSQEGSIKETLISLLISFVMALVFRSYIVEAFIIPTGSMAPTLLGAHMRFQSGQSGYSWAVNPWYYANEETPFSVQGSGPQGAPSATDPMSTSRVNQLFGPGREVSGHGWVTPAEAKPLRAGDRILVQKYLYTLFPPQRFDVVVFKNPELSTQNFIKRLVGLPNEQIWIADGDIFARSHAGSEPGPWKIQRKPRRVQRGVWKPVYASDYAPLDPMRDGRRWFTCPWKGAFWLTEDRSSYRCESSEPTTLAWDSSAWPITSWEPYNEFPGRLGPGRRIELYPISDLRLRAGIVPDREGLSVSATIRSHGHEFQAVIASGRGAIRMRRIAPVSDAALPWIDLASGEAPLFEPGVVTNFEFTHIDQALELHIAGQTIARAEYEWTPEQRLEYAIGRPLAEVLSGDDRVPPLSRAEIYAQSSPALSWSFQGSPVTLHSVGLDRDLYYEPAAFNYGGQPGLGTHPDHLATLGHDQFFVLGDNSASSKDGRLWDTIDPWVADQIDPAIGIVPRDLLLGKAFFVYFPSPDSALGRIPIPDIGRMRFIP